MKAIKECFVIFYNFKKIKLFLFLKLIVGNAMIPKNHNFGPMVIGHMWRLDEAHNWSHSSYS